MRSVQGSVWIGIGDLTSNIFRFLRNIILTRLLAPEVFGEMAIILAINATFESLTSIGLRNLIIQNPRSSEKNFLNASLWTSLIRSSLLYILGFFLAPFVATFYQNPDLTKLIRVCFLATIFTALISPRAYLALKQMGLINTWR